MKPSSFTYHAPTTVGEALEVLAQVAGDGKVLAGGQSLIPILGMRLAAPAHLVDVNRVAGLADIAVEAGGVRVGALVRHRQLERDDTTYRRLPLLRLALEMVAHPTIRNRGTTVGSLVHADPAGEMPAVLALLGGSVELAGPAGRRTVAAADFFRGPLESACRPDELAVSAWFPAPPAGSGTAFLEVARRQGDYALCGVAAVVEVDPDGLVRAARIGCVSVGATPVVLDLTEAVASQRAAAADWAAAGRLAVSLVDPDGDIHATAEYRRHLVGVLTERALLAAGQAAA